LVDLHAFDPSVVTTDADGVARHGGDGLAYETDGFEGRGSIGGRDVACISPATLVRYHTGYEVDADDWHDVRQLCERFGLPVPPDYDRFGTLEEPHRDRPD
jgi:lincosamide nucleotidyltransferase A/C/D/E